MTLDPRAKQLLDLAASQQAAPLKDLSPRRARTRMNASSAMLGEPEAVALVKDDAAIGGDGRRIPIRHVPSRDPRTPADDRLLPRRRLGHRVDRDPRQTLPGDGQRRRGRRWSRSSIGSPPRRSTRPPLHDAFEATAWIAAQAAALGTGRLVVAGDSAGGNLAAAVALMARDAAGRAIDRQILLYPILDYDFDRPSYQRERRRLSAQPRRHDLVLGPLPERPRRGLATARLALPRREPGGAAAGTARDGRVRPAPRRGGRLRRAAGRRRGADDPPPVRRHDPRLRPAAERPSRRPGTSSTEIHAFVRPDAGEGGGQGLSQLSHQSRMAAFCSSVTLWATPSAMMTLSRSSAPAARKASRAESIASVPPRSGSSGRARR